MDTRANWTDGNGLFIGKKFYFFVVKFDHVVFKQVFNICDSVNVLPILDSNGLADFKKLVLMNPILGCSLVIFLWIRTFFVSLTLQTHFLKTQYIAKTTGLAVILD